MMTKSVSGLGEPFAFQSSTEYLVSTYTNALPGQIQITCTILSGSLFPFNLAYFFTSFSASLLYSLIMQLMVLIFVVRVIVVVIVEFSYLWYLVTLIGDQVTSLNTSMLSSVF